MRHAGEYCYKSLMSFSITIGYSVCYDFLSNAYLFVVEVTVCCTCELIHPQLHFTTGRTEPIPLVMKEDTLCLGRLASEVF